MKATLPLFFLVDACGWEILRQRPFLEELAPQRRKLESVFGFSSACVPSIVSGRWPADHRNWCYYVFDPERSPFKKLRALRWIPRALSSRRRVRRLLTRLVGRRFGFSGYFDLYNIPFQQIHLFDFTEKKSPLRPGGMNRGTNIFDFLESNHIDYFASDPDIPEPANFARLLAAIESEEIDFAFSYWPSLDGLLHRVGNLSPEIAPCLQHYQDWIGRVCQAAARHYEEIQLYVFGDHGMANCDELLDLKSKIDALPLRVPKDYAVVYDSTLARFWFFNERARNEITACLAGVPQGRVLADDELKALGTFFPDRYFGELFFLAREGVLIVPSHMGERPLRAMHGYHPSDPHSYAALCSNREIPVSVTAIPHIFQLMTESALKAKTVNRPVPACAGTL
jgi:hypothetical protein